MLPKFRAGGKSFEARLRFRLRFSLRNTLLYSTLAATSTFPRSSFAYDFNEHPLPAAPVELAVEDLLPGTEVQPSVGDGHHHFASHQLPLDVGVAIVLAGLIVLVRAALRGQPFEERIVVLQQALLVVVDVDARGDVHG